MPVSRNILSIICILLLAACVDRIEFDDIKPANFPLVVDGFISDKPGPYTVKLSQSFDIDSKATIRIPVSARRLVISDNDGVLEELTEISKGTYQTSTHGIKGQAGKVYKLRVELSDGKIYESVPDTLLPTGKMDSIYFSYNQNKNSEYGFDVFANSSRESSTSDRFMWSMTGTFKSETHPEFNIKACNYFQGKCNFAPVCSGYRNIGTNLEKIMVKLYPCECCTCWYAIFNESPILNDDYYSTADHFKGVYVGRIPVNGWTFMYKIHVEVRLLSLSRQSFLLFKAIRDQKRAINSLFQPVSGKIPLNFIQLAGANEPIQGLFYATGISSKSKYILRKEVPNREEIPTLERMAQSGVGWVSCLDLFPNATTVMPAFWRD